jgi:malate permease and related proteins
LPIFLAAGAGYALGRRFQLDLRSLSRIAFYVFSPCLVFDSLTHSDLSGPIFAQIGVASLGATLVVASLAFLSGRALRLDRHTLATLIVAATFGNAGNFGLAVSKFAFGDAALSIAVIYYVFNSLAVYTLGVAVAASGKRPWREVIQHGLILPTTIAVVIAALMRLAGLATPQPLDRAIGLLSQSAIPVMLMLLGLQLAGIREFPRARLGLIALAALSQLIVAPLITLGLALALQLNGATLQAVVVESAMPTAVITTILAVEYELDATLVSGTVVLSTLLSPLTLTPLIAFLQRR